MINKKSSVFILGLFYINCSHLTESAIRMSQRRVNKNCGLMKHLSKVERVTHVDAMNPDDFDDHFDCDDDDDVAAMS